MNESAEAGLQRLAAAKGLRVQTKRRLTLKGRHTRVLFLFTNGHRLAFEDQRKFGEVGLLEDVDEFLKNRALGPDALDINLVAIGCVVRPVVLAELPRLNIDAGVVFMRREDFEQIGGYTPSKGGSIDLTATIPVASADSTSAPRSAASRRRAVISTSGSSGMDLR